MDVGNTTSRLRRTFRYPDDTGADNDSDQEVMDEEEQDRFIERLAADNAARDAQFRRLLLAFPLLTTIAYVPSLLHPSTSLFALLALTSLLSTAYLLHVQPPGCTGIAPLDAWIRRGDVGQATADAVNLLQHMPIVSSSPLQTYLPYLNLALVLLVGLMGLVAGREATAAFGWIGLGNLPALVYVVVLVADVIMGSVDPEKELSALKYQYKGA
ncbi:hypothetical protein B0I35DRAFT_202246 [Stachybotrys elegans]|uniref:Uncharacterized protein n=1 Tax=Stachybotrys elegans TaxID=80388 RepID=A0A8K0SU02_9HYPO|nr:hypothetical protein B0I35DRAFT_202246 [Stachybotrys elegans]